MLTRNLEWAMPAEHKIDKIGLELYSVRHILEFDFEGILAKVAEIGYREVEFAGLFAHSPSDVRTMLDRHGLVAPSSHVDYKFLGAEWPKTLEDAHKLGQSYIVCPSIDEPLRSSIDAWKRVAQTFNRAGEESRKAGIQFAYHNHEFEFKALDGKIPYDIILRECDPSLVKMEMDLFWVVEGGAEPITYFDRYPGRFPLVHVKDRKKNGEMVDVGAGVIDFKSIFAQAKKAGIEHYFVEHDEPKNPIASVTNSFEYLRVLSF